MKNTIKAKNGYRINKFKDEFFGEEIRTGITSFVKVDEFTRMVRDGNECVMVCTLTPYCEFKDNELNNECFELCEVFTSVSGNQFVYWRDNEFDIDYISKVPEMYRV